MKESIIGSISRFLKGKNRKIKFLMIAVIFTQAACNKALDIQSIHSSGEAVTWTSITDARSALFGIYGLLRSALAQEDGYWIYGDLRMGDFTSYDRPDLNAVIHNELNGTYSVLNDMENWQRFYAVINAAAVFIEHAPQVAKNDPLYSQANLNEDIAQARALRALTYFYIVRIWGDVPLMTQPYDNGTFPAQARAKQADVLNFAQQELLTAIPNLPYLYGVSPQTYYDQTSSYWNGTLINKISAYAILAHIAAWESRYSDVDVYTNFVMTNAASADVDTTTVDNLTNASTGLFATKSGSQIVGFNFMDALGESSIDGHIEDLTLAAPFVTRANPHIYVSKDSINTIFTDSSDLRFGYDTTSHLYRTAYFTNYSSTIPVFSKIKVVRTGDYQLYGSAIVFTRLEDIILLHAEALAALNRKEDAMDALNMVRSERGVPLYTDKSTENIVDAIFNERRRELMGEGWRWYDQIRYNKIMQTNPAFNQLITNGGIYWPVSQDVINNNPLVTQNSYWK